MKYCVLRMGFGDFCFRSVSPITSLINLSQFFPLCGNSGEGFVIVKNFNFSLPQNWLNRLFGWWWEWELTSLRYFPLSFVDSQLLVQNYWVQIVGHVHAPLSWWDLGVQPQHLEGNIGSWNYCWKTALISAIPAINSPPRSPQTTPSSVTHTHF